MKCNKSVINLVRYYSTQPAVAARKESYYKQQNTKRDEIARPENWARAKPFHDIPGPQALPLVGNMWRFVMGEFKGLNLVELHQKLRSTYGNIVILKGIWGRSDVVFLFSPDDFEVMYRNEGVWPVRDALHSIKYYRTVMRKDIFGGTPGLTAIQGEKWFKFRTLVNPFMMKPKTATRYVASMDIVANDFLNKIHTLVAKNPELPENFENEINKWTFESICYLALNKRFGCLDENPSKESLEMINSTLTVFKQMYTLDVQPSIWKYIETKDFKIFVEHMDNITNTALKHIDETIDKIKKTQTEVDESERSIFENFLQSDRKVAIAMAIDMLTGGVDTTSKTFSAALYYLSKSKDAQSKLRAELRALMPSKDTPITAEILSKASYLKAVIKETTRLAPIAVGNMRRAQNDLVLGGYQIPKGVDVLTCNMIMCQTDEYFPRSKEFIPDRFMRSTTDELSHKHVHPFVFQPFGMGSRSCIGKRLANLEMEVALSKIIRNYYLDWPHEDMKFNTTLIYGIADPLKIHMKAVED